MKALVLRDKRIREFSEKRSASTERTTSSEIEEIDLDHTFQESPQLSIMISKVYVP